MASGFLMSPSDPEELTLFFRVLGDPQNDQAREDYRVWLAARHDRRADAFRVEAALLAATPPPNAPELRAQLALMFITRNDRAWWRRVARTAPIRHCGAAANEPPVMRFKYECDQRWEGLEQTADPNVRRCSQCAHEVHFCATLEEVADRARRGECVTVPPELASQAWNDLRRNITGRPDYDELWAESIFENPKTT